LEAAGCEVLVGAGETQADRLAALLDELGRRRWTNVLVEGGGALLGSFLELGQLDEVHAFIAPKLIGGASAPTPMGGAGIAAMAEALRLQRVCVEQIGDDVYVQGQLQRPDAP
jgi:diaminohydroxyphosphoribosylaminopyrimidine deaminase/5-amino-6-(5-phosphoribosylamino)uracil reductase